MSLKFLISVGVDHCDRMPISGLGIKVFICGYIAERYDINTITLRWPEP